MTNGNEPAPINFLLSREELILVLDLLQTETIPGLDPDPTLGQLNSDQRNLALTIAERALRARELVQAEPNGELIIHKLLLTAVGVCAYPQSAVLVYHWNPTSDAPVRYFGHVRDSDVVAHTRPETALHLFSLLPSKELLAEQVLAVSELEEPQAEDSPFEFTLAGAVLAQVRELATTQHTDEALALLNKQAAAPAGAAEAFVNTLASAPRITIIQTLKQATGGAPEQHDFTLLQNGRQAWLLLAGATDTAPLRVKTTGRTELATMLTNWL